MQVKFKELTLQNFKSHQELTVNFGEKTVIPGDNGEGKTSIGESITFLLYGTDLLGSKLDPTPITYEADSTKVELLFEVDGKQTFLGREINKGRNKFYVNEVPSKATEFNQVVEQLFDKDLFLSLFNPNYFFTLHWEKQRGMILQYVTAPANKEVLKELPKPQKDKLSELVKKHSLEDLNKIHRSNKTKLDKDYISAKSKTETLKGQLKDQEPKVPLESLQVELAQLTKERNEINKAMEGSQETNGRINVLNSRIDSLTTQIDKGRNNHSELKNTELTLKCHACGQDFTDEAKGVSEQHKQDELKKIAEQVNPLIQERKKLREELANLEYVDVTEQLDKANKLQEKISPIEQDIKNHESYKKLEKQVDEAIKSELATRESLNESIFIIDAIKAFHAKEAELQAEKVQALFENLSIRLFETVKTTGEIKPAFVVQMDEKDYPKLSLSESIKAGLELRDVLSDQSNIITPCFVDNAESITRFKEPNGQLILCRVVAGQELKIIRDKVLEVKRDPVTGEEKVTIKEDK